MTARRDVSQGDASDELQDLLDALPVLVSYIDRDLRYVRVNKTYEEWFGRPRQDAVGRTLPDVLGADAYALIRPHVEKALSGQSVTYEARVPYTTGARWIHATYLPRLQGSETIGFIALVSDISGRKQAEDSQRSSLEQFRTLAALAPVGIFRTDANGDCVYVNERWVKLAGLSFDQARGKGWSSALHPDDRERVFAEWYRAASRGEEFVSEYRFKSPAGAVTWIEGRAAPLRDDQGAVAGYLGTVADITERHFEQDRQRYLLEATTLLASSIDYETTLQNVAKMAIPNLADWAALAIREPDGGIKPLTIFCADAEKRREVEDLLARHPFRPDSGRGLAEVLRTGMPLFIPEVTEDFARALAQDPEHARRIRDIGLRSVISVPILVQGQVRGAISFASASPGRTYGPEDFRLGQELARRAGMAIDNAAHYREAQDAVRARHEFLSIASHELRTPLTTLLLQLQGLQRAVRREEKNSGSLAPQAVGGPIDKALAKGEELADLLIELLDHSTMMAGRLKLEPIPEQDLTIAARAAVDSFKDQAARAGVAIHLEAPPRLKGTWDMVRVEQVLYNLVSNAVKYSGGKDIYVRIEEEGDFASLSVRDQGIGIAPEDLDRIFMPFERGARASKFTGWGLGLHIAKQIVEAHGGTIAVESAPGQGATFTVRLPRSGGTPL
jgi:PAS domain S-box-containing protein